jgi:hypothetical protein
MALCFCLIPHPSAIFSSNTLAPVLMGVLVIICTVQSPLGETGLPNVTTTVLTKKYFCPLQII